MTKVTEDQFEIVSDAQVRHRPTGATFSTHRYREPTIISDMTVNPSGGNETDDAGNEYEMEEVKAAARDLLQKLADKRTR